MSDSDGHLWLLPEPAVDGFSRRLGGPALLTPQERTQLARRRTEAARRRALGARLLCRYALSERSGRPLGSWRFRIGPYGRPEPEPTWNGLRFSLAHTEGLIVCLVTRGRSCGVDVETSPADRDAVVYLPRFFAPAERAALERVPDRAARVAEYWVLKEAYLKALGTGLRRDLAGFWFTLGPPGVRLHDPVLRHSARWRFELLNPAPGFVLAAAVENGRGGRLHRTFVDPEELRCP